MNTAEFAKTMNNLFAYSEGFVSGAVSAEPELLRKVANLTKEAVAVYIDKMAKMSPESLHHMYEWYETGSPDARLFNIKYSIRSNNISFTSEFKQSSSIKDGSRKAFRNKAQIMENGTEVTIAPKDAMALSFTIDGNEVFSKTPVVVKNPGGRTAGQFAKTFDEFFSMYYTQAFLSATGFFKQIETPTEFKTSLAAGSKRGKAAGINAGRKWITSVNMEVQ